MRYRWTTEGPDTRIIHLDRRVQTVAGHFGCNPGDEDRLGRACQEAIECLPGVVHCFVEPYLLRVVKAPLFDWSGVVERVAAVVKGQLSPDEEMVEVAADTEERGPSQLRSFLAEAVCRDSPGMFIRPWQRPPCGCPTCKAGREVGGLKASRVVVDESIGVLDRFVADANAMRMPSARDLAPTADPLDQILAKHAEPAKDEAKVAWREWT